MAGVISGAPMNSLIPCLALLMLAAVAFVPARAENLSSLNHGSSPWKIHQTIAAQYPPRLTHNGVTHGEVCVRISIDTKGQLLDALVISCSHLDFGEEALRTVKRWRYEPEWSEGI